MAETYPKTRQSIGTIPELSSVGHVTARADKRQSLNRNNNTLTPLNNVSSSLDSENSLFYPGYSNLGRTRTSSFFNHGRSCSLGGTIPTSIRSRSSRHSRSLSIPSKRVFSPLQRLDTMSFNSHDGSSGASSNLSSPSIPLLHDVSLNKNEINTGASTPCARQPSNATTQHGRISAHFDETMARVLQLPILSYDEGGEGSKLMIDSGTEDELSLAITLALPGQLQLLGSFIGMYAEFDGRLGDKVAGIRHIGMVGLLDGVISTIRGHVSYLAWLRKKKGRAKAKPHSMEDMAAGIVRLYDGGRPHLKTVLSEEVDMYNSTARKAWVTKKDYVLGQILGGFITELNKVEANRICKDEVRKVKSAWIESWDKYAAMTNQELVAAGWMKEKVM